MNNIHAEVDEILRTGNKKAIVSLFLSMQGNYIRATEAEAKLAEARAEIENLKWHINSEKSKAEAALALNDRALGLVNEARADAEHWKSECNTLQRMVHEARAEIERKDKLIEQIHRAMEKVIANYRVNLRDLTDFENKQVATLEAALAAERGE